MTAAPLPSALDASGRWHRLHPLSTLVRAGRGLIALVIVFGATFATSQKDSFGNDIGHLVAVVVLAGAGVVSWLVTRWRVEAGVLRIDSGLLRRTSQRLPLSQIQAIDTVRPGLARVLGLAELRIRMASGHGRAGRLAYLTNSEAESLRARLLALAHGVAEQTPAPPEQPLLTVPPARLAASLLISGPGVVLEAIIVVLVVLAVTAPSAASATLSGGAFGLASFVVGMGRRFNADYRLTLAEAPDGLRLRSGLVETSAETIPRGRVQALRLVEPLTWRPLGWCRLEVDVARQKSSGRQDRSQSRASRALLPVGTHAEAAWLVSRVLPDVPADRRPPPRRVRWKSPLRYRQLSWAGNDHCAVTTSGRLRRTTDMVPLAKVQSIRHVEGPVQRRLGLVSIHLDTAGRSVHSVLRDRDRAEGEALMADLPERCRRARHAAGGVGGPAGISRVGRV